MWGKWFPPSSPVPPGVEFEVGSPRHRKLKAEFRPEDRNLEGFFGSKPCLKGSECGKIQIFLFVKFHFHRLTPGKLGVFALGASSATEWNKKGERHRNYSHHGARRRRDTGYRNKKKDREEKEQRVASLWTATVEEEESFFIRISPRACRSVNVIFLFFKVPISGEGSCCQTRRTIKGREQSVLDITRSCFLILFYSSRPTFFCDFSLWVCDGRWVQHTRMEGREGAGWISIRS